MSPRCVAQVKLAEGLGEDARADVRDTLAAAAAGLEGCVDAHAGLHLDLSVGGGDLTWDLRFVDEAAVAALSARVADAAPEAVLHALGGDLAKLSHAVVAVELAALDPIAGHVGRPGLVGIKRTLWLRVMPEADPAALARFEAETPLLARAVPAIRNWRWSRIRTRAPRPMALRWTHLWEQEFERVDGLQVDYMSAPAHWGYIDRWFDPEMPDRIVDPWLAHLACPASAAVLEWDEPA